MKKPCFVSLSRIRRGWGRAGLSYTLRPVPDKRYWNVARIPSTARKLHSEDSSYRSESGYIYGLNIYTNC
jgi:hypothetical protein